MKSIKQVLTSFGLLDGSGAARGNGGLTHKKIQSCQNWRWQKCLRCRLEILTVLVPFDDGSVLPGKIGMS